MMNIRLALNFDAVELHRLNELFNGEGCNSIEEIECSLKENTQELVAVALDGEDMIGFCCGQLFKSFCYSEYYAEITELYVADKYRRRGIGGRLISFIESEYIKQGIYTFQVFTGADNAVAQNLYSVNNYKKTTEVLYRKKIK